jgi:hypothetical protein
MRAAGLAAPYVHPRYTQVDARVAHADEHGKVVLYLPDNGRDPDVNENREWISRQYERLRDAEKKEKQRQEELNARTSGHASEPAQRQPQIEVAPRPEPERPLPKPAQNGHAQPQVQIRMITSPRKSFTTRTGKLYTADLNGDVWVDEIDKAEIAGQGATEWR